MKIASLSFMGFETGSGRYALGLANSLSDINKVKLFTSSVNKKHKKQFDKKLEFHFFKLLRPYGGIGKKLFGIRNPLNIISLFLLVREIRHYNPNIIHIQNGFEWLFLIYPFIRKYPIVTTLHDPIPHTGENTFLSRRIIKSSIHNSDGIIVHGQRLKKQICQKFSLASNKVHVAKLLFDKYPIMSDISEEENTILFQGRIAKYKGLENLIAAEALVSKRFENFKIIIAGSGDLSIYSDRIYNQSKYEIINHWIDEKDIYPIFQRSSVVVLPYNDATQTGIIPIAYNSSKPVIVTDVGSLSEVVIHGKTGFIIPRKNIAILAYYIIKLLKDKVLRKEMGSNGYNYLTKELTWSNNKNKEQIRSIYKAVMRKKNALR